MTKINPKVMIILGVCGFLVSEFISYYIRVPVVIASLVIFGTGLAMKRIRQGKQINTSYIIKLIVGSILVYIIAYYLVLLLVGVFYHAIGF